VPSRSNDTDSRTAALPALALPWSPKTVIGNEYGDDAMMGAAGWTSLSTAANGVWPALVRGKWEAVILPYVPLYTVHIIEHIQ